MATKNTDFTTSWNVFSWDRPGPLLWVAPAWTKFINMLTELGHGMHSRKAALTKEHHVQVVNITAYLKLHDTPEALKVDTVCHELSWHMMVRTKLVLTALNNCTVVSMLAVNWHLTNPAEVVLEPCSSVLFLYECACSP